MQNYFFFYLLMIFLTLNKVLDNHLDLDQYFFYKKVVYFIFFLVELIDWLIIIQVLKKIKNQLIFLNHYLIQNHLLIISLFINHFNLFHVFYDFSYLLLIQFMQNLLVYVVHYF